LKATRAPRSATPNSGYAKVKSRLGNSWKTVASQAALDIGMVCDPVRLKLTGSRAVKPSGGTAKRQPTTLIAAGQYRRGQSVFLRPDASEPI
jgi:hypothetical protein